MNYDGLERAYWDAQIQRVERLRQKIAARAEVSAGRVIPDDADLTIGSGRRLQATVLFTDISNFSTRPSATQEEQEMMLRVLNLFFTEMIRIVEDYEGAVEKNTGDGLMAYFEDRALTEAGANSVKRALACALTMDSTNEYLITPILRASGVQPLQFRTTMDYGAVTMITANQIALGGSAYGRVPEPWRATWCELSPVKTGWTYGGSSTPYPLYLYRGRWARLV